LEGRLEVFEAVGKEKDAEISAKDQEISFLRRKLDLSTTISEAVSGPRPAERTINPEHNAALTVMVLLQSQLKGSEQKCASYEKANKDLNVKVRDFSNDAKQKGEALEAANKKSGENNEIWNEKLGQERRETYEVMRESNELMRKNEELKRELALKKAAYGTEIYESASSKRSRASR